MSLHKSHRRLAFQRATFTTNRMTQNPTTLWQRGWNWLNSLSEDKAFRAALGFWLIFGLIVAIIVAVQPDRHTATLEYQWAAAKWWKSVTIYQKTNGYLYLPQWAMLYTPYQILPTRIGEPLWRLTMLAFLAWTVWLAAGKISKDRKSAIFLVASVLLLPSAMASARNGQVNMPLGTLYLLSAVMISERKWILTAVLLTLSLALKPISIVPILLCGVLFPRLILPLIVGIILMLAAAFIHPHPSYVMEQYNIFITILLKAGHPKSNNWCDFAGMLRSFGLSLPDLAHLAIRAVAALFALGLAWKASRIRDAFRSAYTVLFLAVVYLMLFNPRTETNSYVMLGTFIGLWVAYEALIAKRLKAAAWLVVFAIILGTENYGWPIFPYTDLWLKALVTSILAVWLAKKLVTSPCGEPVLLKPSDR
ncbi:MAG: glycosyltransferase family 87 protein [Chthoniobacterales bacterium]